MSHLLFGCLTPLGTESTLDGQHEQDSLAAGSFSLPPAPLQPLYPFKYTGDYRIDTLLEGFEDATGQHATGLAALVYQWNSGAPLGSPVRVTYSFMTAKP